VKPRRTLEARLCQQRQKGMHESRVRPRRAPYRFAYANDARRDTTVRKIDLMLHCATVTTGYARVPEWRLSGRARMAV